MIATTPRALAGTAALATAQGECWKCSRCGRHLGTVADGVLTEPNKDRSTLPVVRFCSRCGKRNLLDHPKA